MKRKVGVWIPHGEVWDEFIDVVKAKWGKKHSVLGIELEEAIKAYIKKDDREIGYEEETGYEEPAEVW